MRAWINARTDLVGDGNPLSRGAYLREQRSPADGAYCVLSRSSEGTTAVVAEAAPGLGVARVQALVYAGTEVAAENAASALMEAFQSLLGCPEPCGDTGTHVLVASNHVGPLLIPPPPDTGEIYSFQVQADFLLRSSQ